MFLVEYLPKPGSPEFNPQPVVDVMQYGRVAFGPNPKYGGRWIVEVPSRKVLERILAKNLHGWALYGEPTDLVTQRDRDNIRAIVLEVLDELGIQPGPPQPASAGAVRRGYGQRRKSLAVEDDALGAESEG